MIVDFHTHTFPDAIAQSTVDKLQAMSHVLPFPDGTAAGLRARMRQAGVDWSVVLPVATSARQVPHVNDASALLNQEGDGLVSFGCLHPDYAGWKAELARIAGLGLKGIKLHPIYQDVDLDDPRYLRILDRAGELDLLVLTHAGRDIGYPDRIRCTPEMAKHALAQVGPVKLILAHMGGWRCWDQVEELLGDTGVYLDTAFALGCLIPNGDGFYQPADLPMMRTKQFLRMVRQFGADHILFGTDSPWRDQRQEIEQLRALPLTPEELQAILGGNARRLLGL